MFGLFAGFLQMLSNSSPLTLILSFGAGIITGVFVGFIIKRPRKFNGFVFWGILNLLSTNIGVDALLIGIRQGGEPIGIIISPFLFSACLVINLAFILRHFSKERYDPMNIKY